MLLRNHTCASRHVHSTGRILTPVTKQHVTKSISVLAMGGFFRPLIFLSSFFQLLIRLLSQALNFIQVLYIFKNKCNLFFMSFPGLVTGCTFSRACYWLHVSRIGVAVFPALGTGRTLISLLSIHNIFVWD